MNKYIKPEFMLTSLTASTTAAGGCTISKEDKQMMIEIHGEFAFTIDGKCKVPVEGYCEFTSAEFVNPIKAFGS